MNVGMEAALMQAHLDVSGADGATYRFRRLTELGDLPASAGNFLYVRGPGVVVYAGECDTLQSCLERWETARLLHAAEAVFVRLNISAAVRRAEQADIVAALNPAMNRD